MKTHRLYLLLALFLPLALGGAAQLRERIYLQTDKQVYLAGEHLWMKLYLTDAGGIPVDFSKTGYVELLDDARALIQVKLSLGHGLGEGWMELPARLPSGYYRLVAYTRYMQNEGEAAYFHKTIAIVNTYQTDRSIAADLALASPKSAPPESEGGLRVTPSADAYPTRAQGELRLEGLPANLHSLAVSVAGSEFIPLPETSTIALWSRGLPALSDVRRQDEANSVRPEYEGHILQGRLLDAQTNEPARAEGPILAGFAGDEIRVFGGQVDDRSNIYFHTGGVDGKRRLALVAYGSQANVRVELQSPFVSHPYVRMPAFSLNPAWEEALLQRSVGVQALYSFAYDSISRASSASVPWFRWKPDFTYLLDEYTRFARMPEMFLEFIPYLAFRTYEGEQRLSVSMEDFSPGNPSLVLLDGIPVANHAFLYHYDARRLKRVDVYRSAFYFGGQRFEGVASFSSFGNDHPGLVSSASTRLLDYEGMQPARRFYAPSYPAAKETGRKRIPDYRHTLLWLPQVSANGQPNLRIPFATSDFAGPFQITVEGLTKDGRVLRATASFRVEDSEQ
jgi:hypothetical protein